MSQMGHSRDNTPFPSAMSVAAQASLHSIISHLSSPPPGTDLDYVAVCVRSNDGNALLYPNERDPSLATLLKDSHFQAAIKARTPAIKTLLADMYEVSFHLASPY